MYISINPAIRRATTATAENHQFVGVYLYCLDPQGSAYRGQVSPMPAPFSRLEYPVWQAPLFLALLQQDRAKRSAYLQVARDAIFQRLLELRTAPNRNESLSIVETIDFLRTSKA